MEISEMMEASPFGGYHQWAVPKLADQGQGKLLTKNPAGMPLVSLPVNLAGMLIGVIEIIGGVVAGILFIFPALCCSETASMLLGRAGKTIACGTHMLLVYPAYLLVAHTLGWVDCCMRVVGCFA